MIKIEYCYEKTISFIGGCMSLVVTGIWIIEAYTSAIVEKMQTNGTLWMFWMLMGAMVCFSGVQFIFGLHYKAVAYLDGDGIHIYDKHELIYSLPWKNIESIKLLSGSAVRQHIAIVSSRASYQDKSFIESCPRLTGRMARKYRLDRIMEKLVRAKITTKEFEAQGLYMLAIMPQQYSKIESLWKGTHRRI